MTGLSSNWREHTREQQILVYALCAIEDLKNEGVMAGGHVAPTAIARAAYQEMIAEGFHPTPAELVSAMEGIRAHFARTKAAALKLKCMGTKNDGDEGSTDQTAGEDPQ